MRAFIIYLLSIPAASFAVEPSGRPGSGRSTLLLVSMVVAGLLVMDSRAGTLIYSQRFSPAYGLASCDQGACVQHTLLGSTHFSARSTHPRLTTAPSVRPQRGTRCV